MRLIARLFWNRWFALALLIVASAGVYKAVPLLRLVAGYSAKVACSAVFVSGRGVDSVKRDELGREHLLAALQSLSVDDQQKTVTASVTPLIERRAVYRTGLGCTLLPPSAPIDLHAQGSVRVTQGSDSWPETANLSPDAKQRLDEVMEWAFAEPDPAHPRRTRAVVVLRDGKLLAERYAEGFHAAMPLQGWSMAKSITNALIGILARMGKMDITKPAVVPEWQSDERRHITIDQLMRMSSGLEFAEDYGGLMSDVTRMLFLEPGAGSYAATLPLAHRPDTVWAYSSGTTNILSRLIRDAIGGSLSDYWSFPRRELFDRVGARSVILEPDATGVFVGSSFDYATARDWARLGQLYLQDGVWNGERMLPEGWVSASVTPTPAAPKANYGSHIWLNAGRAMANVTPDLYYFSGFEGQSVAVVPSMGLVAVRLGVSQTSQAWSFEEFNQRLIAALK
ncbi:MAG: serine hydrolase [Bryobacterales bacterium]|nr:serine hydrolase [Bryobacterales bacterium]